MKFTKITNKNEWHGLLCKVLFNTFFHNVEWEEFLEKQFKWLKFERYLYGDSAVLSLARAGNKLISHPFCEYGGPLPLAEKIDYEQFKGDLFSEFNGSIKMSLHPRLFDYFSYAESGIPEVSERVSYWVNDSLDLRKTTHH